MENSEDKKVEITEEEAVNWIKNNNKDINPNEWRVRFYGKLGIDK